MPVRLAVFLACLLLALPAWAAEQHLRYELYAAGLDAVEANATIRENGRAYSADLEAQTRGLLGRLVPWQGSFHSEGVDGRDAMPLPLLHVSTARDRKHTQVQTYRYGGDGTFKAYDVRTDGRDTTPKDVDPVLTRDTTDALSAALASMRVVAAGKPCAGASEVFDGERRYRLVFHDLGRDVLKPSSYTIYGGPAEKCAAEVVPLQGKWHAKPRGWLSIQEQGRKLGTLPLVWMAAIEPGAAAVPVRVQVATAYGTLVMNVIGYANDRHMQLNEADHDTE